MCLGSAGRPLRRDDLDLDLDLDRNRNRNRNRNRSEPVTKRPQSQEQHHKPPCVMGVLFFALLQDIVVPIKGLQRTMVKAMNKALLIPHFGYSDEVELDSLMLLRNQLKGLAVSNHVSVTAHRTIQ